MGLLLTALHRFYSVLTILVGLDDLKGPFQHKPFHDPLAEATDCFWLWDVQPSPVLGLGGIIAFDTNLHNILKV